MKIREKLFHIFRARVIGFNGEQPKYELTLKIQKQTTFDDAEGHKRIFQFVEER